MRVLIDNNDLQTVYDIICLDYTGALSIAAERENQREWADKSGVDKNLSNIRYSTKDFQITCYVKAETTVEAYQKVQVLTDYMSTKGCFVLSLRTEDGTKRMAFLCQRSGILSPNVNVRYQNSLYVFKLGLQDVNPRALTYYNTKVLNSDTGKIETSFKYEKGQVAVLYWGDGTIEQVSNSATYSRDDFAEEGALDIIIDVDKDAAEMGSLVADFTADIVTGIIPHTVQFTNTSTGDILLYAWDFGDGTGSNEENPEKVYTTAGVYTVTLQVFNAAKGWSTEQKKDYVTVRHSRLLINDGGDALLKNSIDYLTKN